MAEPARLITFGLVGTRANHVSEFNSLMARGAESDCVGEFEIEARSLHLDLDDIELEQLHERLRRGAGA
jgi:hypothetical protein